MYDEIDSIELYLIISESMEFSRNRWISLLFFESINWPQTSINWKKSEEFKYINISHVIYQLQNDSMDSHRRMIWQRIQRWLTKDVRAIYIDSLMFLTTMIGCGLSFSVFEWVLYYMTSLLITYHGRRLLTPAPMTLFENDKSFKREYSFGLIEIANAAIMLATDSSDSSLFTRYLFPFDDEQIIIQWTKTYSLRISARKWGHQFNMNEIMSHIIV